MKHTGLKALFFALAVSAQLLAFGQLKVDTSFNPDDLGYGNWLGVRSGISSVNYNSGDVYTQAIQADGKILLGGDFAGYNGFNSPGTSTNLMRLNADGTMDRTFNMDSAGPAGNTQGATMGTVFSILLQPDGKIIIGGSFVSYNGVVVNGICRLQSNGRIDPTFNVGGVGVGGSSPVIKSMLLLADGRIIIGGSFIGYNYVNANGIARLNNNGSIDNTFNVAGAGLTINSISIPYSINTIVLQPDSKLLLGGQFSTYNGVSKSNIVRINFDGSLDNTFSTTFVSSKINVIKLNPDNKIWAGGANLTPTNNTSYVWGVILLNTDGSRATSFAPYPAAGENSTLEVKALLLTADGKIVVTGNNLNTYSNFPITSNMLRLFVSGSVDYAFFNHPIGGQGIYNMQSIQDGSIIFSGNFQTYGNNSVYKYNPAFETDTAFNAPYGVRGYKVTTFARQNDGNKIIVAGNFFRVNNRLRQSIARVFANGTIDLAFDAGTGPSTNSDITKIIIQPDNKAILIGNFTSFNEVNAKKIIRINENGSVDMTFFANLGTGADADIYTVALQPDGKIIVGGNFVTFNGYAVNHLVRLNSNGTVDNSFVQLTSPAWYNIRDIEIQSTGKIFAAGDFGTPYPNTLSSNIIKLNIDGTKDASFQNDKYIMGGLIYDIELASDTSVFIAGFFTTYDFKPTKGLLKLKPNGRVDSSFSYSNANTKYPYYIKSYPNGKLLVKTSSFVSSIFPDMYRIHTNGSIDTTFSSLAGFRLTVEPNSFEIIGNGNKLLMGGTFTSFNGIGKNRFARITDTTIAESVVPLQLISLKANLQDNKVLLTWVSKNEENIKDFTLQRSTNGTSFSSIANIAANNLLSINSYQQIDNISLASIPLGKLYYRLKIQEKDGKITYSTIIPVSLVNKTGIAVFPNPANSTLWLQLQTSATKENIEVNILDISGKRIYSQLQEIKSGLNVLPLNIAALQPGTYFIEANGKSLHNTITFIKQ